MEVAFYYLKMLGHFIISEYTTGFRFFAECLRHLAKAKLHPAKNTRQKFDQQSPLCRVSFIGHSTKPLPRAPQALGKEKRPSRRWPRWRWLCRVPTLQALGKYFLFFFKKNSLPSAHWLALGKVWIFFNKNSLPSALLPALGKVWIFF